MADTPKTPKPAARKPRKPATKAPARKPAKPRAAARPAATAAAAGGTATALSIGAAVVAVGAAIAGFVARRQIAALAAPDTFGDSAEHAAPDLAVDLPRAEADTRAPVDFRPDMDAPMTPAEREALRPATGPAPSLVAEAGTLNSQTGASN